MKPQTAFLIATILSLGLGWVTSIPLNLRLIRLLTSKRMVGKRAREVEDVIRKLPFSVLNIFFTMMSFNLLNAVLFLWLSLFAANLGAIQILIVVGLECLISLMFLSIYLYLLDKRLSELIKD